MSKDYKILLIQYPCTTTTTTTTTTITTILRSSDAEFW